MVARAYGLRVIATGTTLETKDIITRCGAHTVIQYSSQDYVENILVNILYNISLQKMSFKYLVKIIPGFMFRFALNNFQCIPACLTECYVQ